MSDPTLENPILPKPVSAIDKTTPPPKKSKRPKTPYPPSLQMKPKSFLKELTLPGKMAQKPSLSLYSSPVLKDAWPMTWAVLKLLTLR